MWKNYEQYYQMSLQDLFVKMYLPTPSARAGCDTRPILSGVSSSSSSSSCHAASADIPDPLSPFLPIIHRLRQVFRVTSCVLTQLLYVSSCWSSYFCTSICGGPQEYIAYELVLASPAVSRVSGSSDLYSFRDGGQVSVQLESRGVLSPGLV